MLQMSPERSPSFLSGQCLSFTVYTATESPEDHGISGFTE